MIKALYVDDEPDLLTIGKLFLERSGRITLDTAFSAKEAIRQLKKSSYDVVISDYQMPDVDGIRFLKKIRAEYGDLPFILFTGKSREEIVIDALNNGADFYIQKGGEPRSQFAELEHKVCQAVDKHRAQTRLHYYNRLYAVMNGFNEAALAAYSREFLYREICRIVVDEGKFVSAWIGVTDQKTGNLVPFASWAIPGDLLFPVNPENIGKEKTISLHMEIAREAATRGEPKVKSAIGPGGSSYRDDPDDERVHYRSTAALPLVTGGRSILVLQVYAKEPNFFRQKEIRLLAASLSSISCVIQAMESRHARDSTSSGCSFKNSNVCMSILDHASDGILIVQDNKIRYFNAKCLQVLSGYSQNDLMTVEFTRLVHQDDQERVQERYTKWVAGERPCSVLSFKVCDGVGVLRWVTCRAVPAEWEGRLAALVYLSDITERKLSEEALYQANQKNILISRILRHDIANRLTVVRGHLNRIKREPTLPGQNTYLERADRAAADIHRLLETARLYQDIGMNSACWQNVGDIIREISAGIGEACGVDVSVFTGQLEILADPLLPNVIANLLDNAIRHGKTVTKIRVYPAVSKNVATLIWEDDGIGIPPERKEDVFEAGFGVHTGLGLFFAREILSLTGIAILESGRFGSGCRFEIHVPKGSFRYTSGTAEQRAQIPVKPIKPAGNMPAH
ncbi:MAG: response regulator [Methanoregula sp.]|jgi:PAS domain S-box-containing protein